MAGASGIWFSGSKGRPDLLWKTDQVTIAVATSLHDEAGHGIDFAKPPPSAPVLTGSLARTKLRYDRLSNLLWWLKRHCHRWFPR